MILLALNNCGDSTPREMTKGHMDAVKEQCKNEPDKKLCGKEVRIKFKKDGHKYVSLLNSKLFFLWTLVCFVVSYKIKLENFRTCIHKRKQIHYISSHI